MMRQISISKNDGIRYVFRYSRGYEHKVIDAMAELATRKDSGFEWLDAAVLSYQMGRRLKEETLDI